MGERAIRAVLVGVLAGAVLAACAADPSGRLTVGTPPAVTAAPSTAALEPPLPSPVAVVTIEDLANAAHDDIIKAEADITAFGQRGCYTDSSPCDDTFMTKMGTDAGNVATDLSNEFIGASPLSDGSQQDLLANTVYYGNTLQADLENGMPADGTGFDLGFRPDMMQFSSLLAEWDPYVGNDYQG